MLSRTHEDFIVDFLNNIFNFLQIKILKNKLVARALKALNGNFSKEYFNFVFLKNFSSKAIKVSNVIGVFSDVIKALNINFEIMFFFNDHRSFQRKLLKNIFSKIIEAKNLFYRILFQKEVKALKLYLKDNVLPSKLLVETFKEYLFKHNICFKLRFLEDSFSRAIIDLYGTFLQELSKL